MVLKILYWATTDYTHTSKAYYQFSARAVKHVLEQGLLQLVQEARCVVQWPERDSLKEGVGTVKPLTVAGCSCSLAVAAAAAAAVAGWLACVQKQPSRCLFYSGQVVVLQWLLQMLGSWVHSKVESGSQALMHWNLGPVFSEKRENSWMKLQYTMDLVHILEL